MQGRMLIFNKATGEIMGVISGHLLDGDYDPETEGFLPTTLSDRELLHGSYVLNDTVLPRPALPVTQAGNTLTVPVGTEYFVLGPVFLDGVAEDGVLEFEFAEPGTYTVVLRLFPYLDAEVTLES